ncbi:MAG: class I SAM-dependent methyltransferase [bacterium]
MNPIPDGTEVYWDGRHYDLDNKSSPDDFPFYLKAAKKAHGPVLELACGTGRLSIQLARCGLDITGLDVSPGMLLQSREKGKTLGLKIKWILADATRFNLKRKFKLIFIPYNSMQHIHDWRAIENLFRCVRRHLAPGGRFIFDVFNPHPAYFVRDPEEPLPVGCYPDPYDGKELSVMETNVYDRATQVNRIVWHYWKGGRLVRSRRLNMRCFYPQELESLLSFGGWRILARYGDFNRKPFQSKSMKQIFILAPR